MYTIILNKPTFQKKDTEAIAGFKKISTFASAFERDAISKNGALVQLVRIHACHAWGHGFESRTHRERE